MAFIAGQLVKITLAHEGMAVGTMLTVTIPDARNEMGEGWSKGRITLLAPGSSASIRVGVTLFFYTKNAILANRKERVQFNLRKIGELERKIAIIREDLSSLNMYSSDEEQLAYETLNYIGVEPKESTIKKLSKFFSDRLVLQ